LKGRYLGNDRRILLNGISERKCWKEYAGFIWLRIRDNDGLFGMRRSCLISIPSRHSPRENEENNGKYLPEQSYLAETGIRSSN
jgi:hypothetical protein